MGDTGNILPIVQSNVSTWARDSALVAPYNVPGEKCHDLQPSQLTTVLREREGVSAPKPGVPLPDVTLHIASIT